MFNDLFNIKIEQDITIYLKDKIDEKAFDNILIKIGLTSIEIKNSEKSEIYYKFSLTAKIYTSHMNDFFIGSHIKLDAEKSSICIYGYNENIISDMKKYFLKKKYLMKYMIKLKSIKIILKNMKRIRTILSKKSKKKKKPNRIIYLLSNIL